MGVNSSSHNILLFVLCIINNFSLFGLRVLLRIKLTSYAKANTIAITVSLNFLLCTKPYSF